MNTPQRNLIAVILAIVPINSAIITYRLTHPEGFTTEQMLIFPLLFGGCASILILLLNRYYLGMTFRSTFHSGAGSLSSDMLHGIMLTGLYFLLTFAERATLFRWLPQNVSGSDEVLRAVTELANNPLYLIIWFGPVLWVGVAFYEEISRTFFLKCLWNLNSGKIWHFTAIIIVSAIIGLLHFYQGLPAIFSIGFKSAVVGFYFYRFRRLFPLVLSHALYDGIQFGSLVMQLTG